VTSVFNPSYAQQRCSKEAAAFPTARLNCSRPPYGEDESPYPGGAGSFRSIMRFFFLSFEAAEQPIVWLIYCPVTASEEDNLGRTE
jgi:hypothetical protein